MTLTSTDLRCDLHIGGQFLPSESGRRFEVANPSDGTQIAQVADGTIHDALAALDAAHQAGAGWVATAPRTRSQILSTAFEQLTRRREEIAHLISLENGKALADARSEVTYAAEFFRWYAEETVRALGSTVSSPSGSHQILVRHEPVGVCVLVTPWNFPAAMATRKIAPALGAGCTVVLKPASDTPLTALLIAEILGDAGVPDGVVNVVTSRSSGQVVSAMLHDERVRKVSFTGSTEVGRMLLHEAADRVVNSSMELGGNAPFIVFDDADLDAAVDGAMIAKMRNGGSACTAANRLLVHASIAEEFARRLTARMAALTLGPGTDPDTDVGPLVNEATVDKVDELVRGAIAQGAVATTGGTRPEGPGWFYAPTVLTSVPQNASILREEIFGPVAPIVTFDTDDEAIALANDTEYGLVSYVFTSDLARGMRISERLETGMVGLNRGLVSDPAAPFGGVKQSGIGREGGHEGLLDYTESKYVAVQW